MTSLYLESYSTCYNGIIRNGTDGANFVLELLSTELECPEKERQYHCRRLSGISKKSAGPRAQCQG